VRTISLTILLIFSCLVVGCTQDPVIKENPGVENNPVADDKLTIEYSVGQAYWTTRTLVTSEDTAEGKIGLYKYDRYYTVIDAIDSEGTPVAGRRMYRESFFELTGKRNLKGEGDYQNKTVIFKPDTVPTVEGNPVDDQATTGLRLTGFEYIFMPEKVTNDSRFHRVTLDESKERVLKAFLTEMRIVPDVSLISARIAENTDELVKIQFTWHVSGIILDKNGVGVRMKFDGQIIYSKKHKGITYFELVKQPEKDDSATLKLIINRDFEREFE